MVLRLGYPDRIVEVREGRVYVFRGKLFSAPLDDVIEYVLKGDTPLPPEIRTISRAVFDALLREGYSLDEVGDENGRLFYVSA